MQSAELSTRAAKDKVNAQQLLYTDTRTYIILRMHIRASIHKIRHHLVMTMPTSKMQGSPSILNTYTVSTLPVIIIKQISPLPRFYN